MTLLFNHQPIATPLACYHWWSHPNEPAPYRNLRTPLILSIATLRAVSDISIVVLDMSGKPNDWGNFPSKLRFTVIAENFVLKPYQDLVEGWQYLSRIFDIHKVFHRPIVYVDSDIFFFKNPLPLTKNPERFCFDGWNTGFFYFDPSSNSNKLWYEIFESYTKAAIYSEDVRKLMRRHLSYDGWYGVWDEMILTFMAHEHPNLFNLIPVEEHICARNITSVNKSNAKIFHCNGTMMENAITNTKHSRGLMCLIIKEFYENIRLILNQADIDLIFTKEEQDYYLPKQFSLLQQTDRLLKTKDESGHFHIHQAI